MSDFRRRFVRFSVLLLPAFLALAALHYFRNDLRDSVSLWLTPGERRGKHVFVDRGGKDRVDKLSKWTETVISQLQDRKHRAFGFKAPESGFRIEIRRDGAGSEYDPVSNRIVIRGFPDESPAEAARADLSRLIARAMLRAGAPANAEFSPWFEEGVSTYFEGTSETLGSRKDDLIHTARLNGPETLAAALASREGAYFSAVSHSIVAFIKQAYREALITEYVNVEREPGPVPAGTFERIFGADAGIHWRDYLDQGWKGS